MAISWSRSTRHVSSQTPRKARPLLSGRRRLIRSIRMPRPTQWTLSILLGPRLRSPSRLRWTLRPPQTTHRTQCNPRTRWSLRTRWTFSSLQTRWTRLTPQRHLILKSPSTRSRRKTPPPPIPTPTPTPITVCITRKCPVSALVMKTSNKAGHPVKPERPVWTSPLAKTMRRIKATATPILADLAAKAALQTQVALAAKGNLVVLMAPVVPVGGPAQGGGPNPGRPSGRN